MRKWLVILPILFFGCKTRQATIIYENKRDSVRFELLATPRVLNKFVRQVERTERINISSDKRKSIVESKNDLKQAISNDKKETNISRQQNKTQQVESKQEGKTERKEAQLEIVKNKQLPNTIKWIAILGIVLIFGYLVIKKKIPLLR